MTARARRDLASTTPADPAERAREIALRALTHSARSESQLRETLTARGIESAVIDHVLTRYREVGLVDDNALAAAIVRTRHHERGQSRRAIAQELTRKGFDDGAIASALAQIDDDAEWRAARELATRRWQRTAELDDDARIRRVVGMLGRKGYSPDVAFAVVRELQHADKDNT